MNTFELIFSNSIRLKMDWAKKNPGYNFTGLYSI